MTRQSPFNPAKNPRVRRPLHESKKNSASDPTASPAKRMRMKKIKLTSMNRKPRAKGASRKSSCTEGKNERVSSQDSESTVEMKAKSIDGQSNILVAVRVRPMLLKDVERGLINIVRTVERKTISLLDPNFDMDSMLRKKRSREHRYSFDHVFDGAADQREVYDNTVRFLLPGLLQGFNTTVFTYGQTGSGKTFTMIGTEKKPGLMYLTLEELFQQINSMSSTIDFTITVSFLEVYNEVIRDLLNPSAGVLDLREDAVKGIRVAGLTEVQTTGVADAMELLRTGNKNRTQEPTRANQESSRSYAVAQVLIEQRDRIRKNVVEHIKVAKLAMVDLAGSERASISQNRGLRQLEGANINRSLLALGNCITALGERRHKGAYVAYRDSKLTRLLKDSLGGNCRTAMITTISPTHDSMEDSLNSLKYASRARNISTKVVRNVFKVDQHITMYTSIIEDLRNEIEGLKIKLAHSPERNTGDKVFQQKTNSNILLSPCSPSRVGEVQQRRKSASDSLFSTLENGKMSTKELKDFEQQKSEYISHFEEKLTLSKSIFDLENLEISNQIHVNAIQVEVSKSNNQKNVNGYDICENETPRAVTEAREELKVLLQNMAKNDDLKREFRDKLEEREEKCQKLREKLLQLARTQELRELLQLLYRNHVLELENMELIATAQTHHDASKEKYLQIEKLELQIRLRDNVIAKQRTQLEENHIAQLDHPETHGILNFDSTHPFKRIHAHKKIRSREFNMNITATTDAAAAIATQPIKELPKTNVVVSSKRLSSRRDPESLLSIRRKEKRKKKEREKKNELLELWEKDSVLGEGFMSLPTTMQRSMERTERSSHKGILTSRSVQDVSKTDTSPRNRQKLEPGARVTAAVATAGTHDQRNGDSNGMEMKFGLVGKRALPRTVHNKHNTNEKDSENEVTNKKSSETPLKGQLLLLKNKGSSPSLIVSSAFRPSRPQQSKVR